MEKIKQSWKAIFFRYNVITLVVFLLGLLFVSGASYLAILSRDSGRSQKFNDQVSHIEHTISDNFDFFLRILGGAQGFFAGSEFVSRAEWNIYMSKLSPETFGRGIRFMSYIAQVPENSKTDFLARTRKDYLFYKYLNDYKIYPERKADVYYPINYIYPLSGLEKGLGYDLGSGENYISALELARDSGAMEIVGPITFVIDPQDVQKNDFLLLLPVYRQGDRIDTVEDRRASILGFVALGLSPRDFVNSSLSMRDLENDLNLAVFNSPEISKNNLLYSNYSRLPEALDFDSDKFNRKFRFNFGKNSWTFYFAPQSGIKLGDFRDSFPSIVLLAGLGINLLVSLIINNIISSRKGAEKFAAEAVEKFKSAQLQYNLLIDEASDPIVLIDENGNVQYINKAGTDLIGYSKEEIVGKTILDTGTVDITDLPKVLDNFKADLRGEKTPPFDLNMIKKNGERLILEANSSLIGGDRKIIQVIFRDVTGKRLEEGQTKKYMENLERINKLMVDRELKIIELKVELENLKKKPL